MYLEYSQKARFSIRKSTTKRKNDENNLDNLRVRRKLDFSDKVFIHRASLSNIGPTKAHRLRVTFMGGYHKDPGKNSSQSPPHIDHHCCYECGDSLDSIFFHQCTCESCGNGAHYGYNCPPKVLIISNPEPCHNQNVDEFPQTLLSFHPTCYSGDENSFAYDSTSNFVDDSPNVFNPPPQPPTNSYEFCGNDAHYSHDYEVIKSSVEDLVPIPSESEGIFDDTCDVPFCDNSPPLDISKDQFEDFFDSNNDSTSIDDYYYSIDDINYVEASLLDSELISLEEVKDDIFREKLLSIHLLIAKIESLNENPTPDLVLKSPSLFSIPVEDSDSFFEKSDTSLSYSDNSLPNSRLLAIIRKRRGELTSVVMEDNLGEPRVHVPNVLATHPTLMLDSDFIPSDNSLPEFKIFCFDIEEENSGGTTIHAGIFLSDFDHFHFKIEPDLGDLTSIINPGIRENISITNVNLSPEDDQSPLFAYVIWIFLPFLTYPVAPPYILSSGNEDTIFDPDIFIYHSFMPCVSHRSGTFIKFNVYPNHLNVSPMEILSSTCFPMDQ
uniref:Protein FAR1-related sequence 5-like n=1 Tax=Tanacetum cinerariifolium TaxID=118510 RepID=A0A6L2N9Q6_TANCI|nr:protein FAR1-related sequence 5-like [Tanacetum cinerariifolium]